MAISKWLENNKGDSLDIDIKNLIRVPMVYQPNIYSCGCAAVQSIMKFYGKEFLYEDLEKKLKTDPKKGTAINDIIKFAESEGMVAKLKTNMSLEALWKFIDNETPILVAIQAWTESKKPDWANDWKDGHYVVAIGYDDENTYFMDPSVFGNYAYIPIKEFVERWHDLDESKKLINPGIVIVSGTSERYSQDMLKRIK